MHSSSYFPDRSRRHRYLGEFTETVQESGSPRIVVSSDPPHRRNRRDEHDSVSGPTTRVVTGEGLQLWSDFGLRPGPTLVGWDVTLPHAILGNQVREGSARNGYQRAVEVRPAQPGTAVHAGKSGHPRHRHGWYWRLGHEPDQRRCR